MTDAAEALSAEEEAASLEEAYQEPQKRVLNPEAIGASLLERMPSPTGWRLLILPYQGKGKTDGGLYLPDDVVEKNKVSTQVGYVLKVGPWPIRTRKNFRAVRGARRKTGSCLPAMPAAVLPLTGARFAS